jgi:hypothetical protein
MLTNMWTKSTRSGNNGQCVMMRLQDDGAVAVKDSKNPDGPVLVFRGDQWRAFIEGVKAGEADR